MAKPDPQLIPEPLISLASHPSLSTTTPKATTANSDRWLMFDKTPEQFKPPAVALAAVQLIAA